MFASVLAALLLSTAATSAAPSGCGMVDALKASATAKTTADANRRTAMLLAEQGKWRAAATALESGGSDDASRLMLAYFVLRSGDAERAARLLREFSDEQRGSLAGHWVAAELALERNDAETAAEELEAARATTTVDPLFWSICCRGQTIDSAALDALLRARVALLRDDPETAVRSLRETRTPEGRLFLARAMKAAGRIAEAVRELESLGRELPPCAGVWREHLLFEAALAASEIDTASAETLYREAIEAAEEQERAFSAAVHEAKLTGLFVAAMRDPSHAAPESRNNLGHLLVARANGDLATLTVAQAELRRAARSRDYATPQYAFIGLARAALAAGDREVAAMEVMNALWRDPRHDDALEISRVLLRDAPMEARLGLGVMFTATTSEALPRRFVTREYGRELAQLDEAAATHDHELARQFAGVRALARNDFERARELARAARATSSSDWPDAVEGAALAAMGRNEEAQTIFRALKERVSSRPPRNPWDAATLRAAALAFSDVAREGGDAASRTAAAALIAEVARPASVHGRAAPWEPRPGLAGVVAEADGDEPLPGIVVTVFTEAGQREVVTDTKGRWRVPDLAPGFYSVVARLEGMQSSTAIAEVTTGEREVAMALKLGSVDEEVTVTGGTPLDRLAQFVRVYDFDEIPLSARDVSLSGLSIDGASSADNRFMIDGAVDNQFAINGAFVPDAELTHTRSDLLLSSAIEEVQVLTSGYTAEVGRASGPVVSVATRSGTNEFSGKVAIEAGRDQESAEAVAMPRALANDRAEAIARFHVGGPLRPDVLHWFLSGDWQQERGEPQPALQQDLTPRGESRGRLLDLFAKVSGSAPSAFANLSARTRQVDRNGVVDDPGGSAFGDASSIDRRQKTRNDVLSLRAGGIFGFASTVDLTAVRSHERSSLRPGSDAANESQVRFPEHGFYTDGGIGFINDGRDLERTSVRAKGSRFLWSGHEVVGGLDAEWDDDSVSDRISGDMLLDASSESRRFWTYGDDPEPVAAVQETFDGTETSAYIAHTWRAERFTVQAGLRWTRQTAGFPRDFELSPSALLPRLGVAVDPDGSERWNIYGYYGRFFESIRRDDRVAYGSDRRYVFEDPGEESPLSYGRLSAIDPDLRAPLSDLWGAGVEHGEPWHWQLGAQYRRLVSHIEDFFCTADRRRCVGNPGSGIMRQLPRARREHLSLTGRMWHTTRSSHWEVVYTWQHAEGNTEPPDLASTRVAGIDPYARTAFDDAGLVSDGDLPLPRHSFRANAYATAHDVISTHDLVLSAALIAQSGVPRGAFGYSPLYGRYVTTLVPRGGEGDGAALVSLHAGIDYAIPVGKSALKLSLIGRNLLGSQTSTIDDQRAMLTASDLEAFPNPTFLQPMERSEPRSLRALVALTF